MPRAGGESDKLGNRYEAVWTIGRLLELATGEFAGLTVEPFGENALGIEFIVQHHDGSQEFHSVKRQRASGEWTLSALASGSKKEERSILSDLFGKLSADSRATCSFVSSTGANDLRELSERAQQHQNLSDFKENLDPSVRLRQAFEKHVLPIISNDWELAHNHLRRSHVVLIDEKTLTKQVEQNARLHIYRPKYNNFSATEVRLLLWGFLWDNLGSVIQQDAVWEFLEQYDYAKRDWATDTNILEVVRERNQEYTRKVKSELINGTYLPRKETQGIVDEVMRQCGNKKILVSASAGVGKSCVIAQVVEKLSLRNLPTIVVRMDRYGETLTTQDVGMKMDLPMSPTIVLAGMANGGDCVLIVEQLDAVSQVSGRYPHLWEVFDSLCHEVSAYPNMKLIIACRDFDLQHDHRLRKLNQPVFVKHIKIELLSVEEVEAAIKNSGCKDIQLNSRQIEILKTPLHLFLFLDEINDDQTAVSFQNIGELFDRYWEAKQRNVSERLKNKSDWTAIIDSLCRSMSQNLNLYVQKNTLDDWSETVEAMLTEHVLVQDKAQVQFFHESFFDYAFARRFASSGQSIINLLQSGEQHLFRRGQVRQVLAYLRDNNREEYITQLRELLNGSTIRFHIKRLVIAWLGTLPNPESDEWEVIEPLLDEPDIQKHLFPSLRNNLSWFDLLQELGVIEQWLDSSDEKRIDKGIWFLMFNQVQEQRSEVVAKLLTPYLNHSPEWTKRIRWYFNWGHTYHSRSIQELFLHLVNDGSFEKESTKKDESWWNYLRDAIEPAPLFVLEVVTHWLDQKIETASVSLDSMVDELRDNDQMASQLFIDIARSNPEPFIRRILPRVLELINLTTIPMSNGLQLNRIWRWSPSHESMHINDSILDALTDSFKKLAVDNPNELDSIIVNLLETKSQTIVYLLLRTWSANPTYFATQCVQFLATEQGRLDVGYGSTRGGGSGDAAISREAIQTCVPQATPDDRERLEHAITNFSIPEEKVIYQDWVEYLLLISFGEKHLSMSGQDRLQTLKEQFPNEDTRIPSRRIGGARCVVSPISPDKTQKFSNDEWLSAMRQFDYGWDGISRGTNPETRGTAVELSRVLQPQARGERRRFSTLVNQMEDSIRMEYFEAILNGICGVENLSKEERESDDNDFKLLETEVVVDVIRRLHQLPNRPCGSSICRAFERLANRKIRENDLQILKFYAIEDPNPDSEYKFPQDDLNSRDPAEDAYSHGYNSVRGRAARAIEQLLFGDYSRSTTLLPIIREMVSDPSIAVRTCVIDALLPILNHDRDEAIRLFLEICAEQEIIYGCHSFDNFIYYAISTHYSLLRDTLQKALRSSIDSAVTVAARQICLAAFNDEVVEIDSKSVREGSKIMRLAAAEIYSSNIGDATVGLVCQQHLSRMFADESEEVRTMAAGCFGHLDDADFNKYENFVQNYIESLAFPDQHDILLRHLEKSTWQLPDRIIILLAERFIITSGSAASDVSTAASFDATTISKLVIRLYAQSNDEIVRSHCLDLIDEMERLVFYGIGSQLDKHDR